MKPGTFIVEGVDSDTHHIYIQDRPDIVSPRRRVSFEQSFGRDGDIPFDDEVYDNTTSEWKLLLVGDISSRSENRKKLMRMLNSGTYLKIQHYYDPDKYYYGMLNDSITFTNKAFMEEHQVATVKLTLKPYKTYVNSPTIQLTQSLNVKNETDATALPRFKLTGNGDCTLTVGGRTFVIKNIVGHIWIDSDLEYAYRETPTVINENPKVYTRDYPILKPGNNVITWTGTFTVQLEPRWRSLV